MANRKIGQAGLALIKQYEGCRLAAYRCAAGVWTIGYGHTAGIHSGMTITQAQAEKLADKLTGLRIFEDENEKMNRSLTDVGGQLLIVSQFTLYANCKKGRRPEFLAAARPEVAIPLYEKFVQLCRDKGFHTETGEFGAYMQVDSLNDGPLTIILDTDTL